MVKTSIKLFLWGLLLWPIFINIVGVISPLWAIHVLHDGSRSEDLLGFFQKYVPLVSILFASSLLFLSKVDSRLWIKTSCWIASIIYMSCSIYGLLSMEEFIYFVLIGISSFMEILMLFLGGIILLGIFDSTNASEEHASSAI